MIPYNSAWVSGDRWHLGTLGSHSAHLWFVSTNYAYPQVIKHAWPVIFPVKLSRLEWISRRHVWLSDGTSNYLLKWRYRQSYSLVPSIYEHPWNIHEYPFISIAITEYPWNISETSVTYPRNIGEMTMKTSIDIPWISSQHSGQNSGVSHRSGIWDPRQLRFQHHLAQNEACLLCLCCHDFFYSGAKYEMFLGNCIEKSLLSFTCLSLWSSFGSSRAGHGNPISLFNSLRISSPLFSFTLRTKTWGTKKKEHHGRSQWPYNMTIYDHVISDDSRRASQVSPRFEQDRSTLWRSTLDLSMAPEARHETLPERRWKFLGYVMAVFHGTWSQYIII